MLFAVWQKELNRTIMGKLDPRDYKYAPVDADEDFDPKHNEWVVEETIRKYERERARRQKEFGEGVGDRSSALASYLTARSQGQRSSNIKKYFNSKDLARLRGEELLPKLKEAYHAKKKS